MLKSSILSQFPNQEQDQKEAEVIEKLTDLKARKQKHALFPAGKNLHMYRTGNI